jgi:ATP-dependent DNA ligase
MSNTPASSSLTIENFIAAGRAKSKGKVKASILERWNTRVVPRGLHKQGGKGAGAYLDSYGKGISSGKIAELAICAETNGAGDMAKAFWEAAFFLETGVQASAGGASVSCVKAAAGGLSKPTSHFPDALQPGLVHTMQAVDASLPREYFVENDAYYGQPKRDGFRNVLFATGDMVAHQSRSTSAMGSIDADLEGAVKRVAGAVGPFILDGERYYLSAKGSEHRTAAQAAAANIEAGNGEILPIAVYGVFKALFAGGKDLRDCSEDERINAGRRIAAMIGEANSGTAKVEMLPTAATPEEKKKMIERQKREGREGEIWVRKDCAYTGGKGHKTDMIRTKYVDESIYTVIAITTSKERKGGVASIEVAGENGIPVGSVGTGFHDSLGKELVKLHRQTPGGVRVLVRHQGTTEQGKLWHARVLEIVN